jgi:hypothetical protein
VSEPVIALAEGLLDHQLLDAAGRRCGKVDDLELAAAPDGRLVVTAVWSGPGAWGDRVPRRARRAWRALLRPTGRGAARVEWARVREIGPAIQLDVAAGELGLAHGDDVAARVVRRLPWS